MNSSNSYTDLLKNPLSLIILSPPITHLRMAANTMSANLFKKSTKVAEKVDNNMTGATNLVNSFAKETIEAADKLLEEVNSYAIQEGIEKAANSLQENFPLPETYSWLKVVQKDQEAVNDIRLVAITAFLYDLSDYPSGTTLEHDEIHKCLNLPNAFREPDSVWKTLSQKAQDQYRLHVETVKEEIFSRAADYYKLVHASTSCVSLEP